MKRDEKSALTRQKILLAAMQEFSEQGYENASLNTICAEHNISKGIIYHHFKSKDELYLLCVAECFHAMTVYLKNTLPVLSGSAEQKLQKYFDVRLHFFVDNPLYFGIISDVFLRPATALSAEITDCRKEFDAFNLSILTDFLQGETLREGLTVSSIIEDFRIYIDFFHFRFKADMNAKYPSKTVLREYEERCHRQLDILLHGVLGKYDDK